MLIRFGYVAMSVHVSNASPSRTMTATRFQAIPDREAAIRKLERIAAENLESTLRLLKYNRGEGIQLYRLSSKLIPLLTHELLEGWTPIETLADEFRAVGDYAKTNGMRLSFHPDHFTVLSTPRPEVLVKSELDLDRHVAMLEAMGLDERYKCNIHLGGTYGDKPAAYERFLRQFAELPARIRGRVTLENDDKTFTARETLAASQAAGVPMVLDIHHHAVNNGGERAEELWEEIAQTWDREKERLAAFGGDDELLLTPKIHVSSPKSAADPRGHADYVDVEPFLAFARAVAGVTPRLDVMLEAKRKDDALLRLLADLEGRPGITRLEGAAVRLEG